MASGVSGRSSDQLLALAGAVPRSTNRSAAAWGYRAGFGGHGEYGVLGATFEPHEFPYLRLSVATTLTLAATGPDPFGQARVGLPFEYAGGVMAGALAEPDRVGPGTLTFDCAPCHETDSSWEVSRPLAVGVVRLLGLTSDEAIPVDLLPRFGGSVPEPPGVD